MNFQMIRPEASASNLSLKTMEAPWRFFTLTRNRHHCISIALEPLRLSPISAFAKGIVPGLRHN